MRLGILADIHGNLKSLRVALDVFRRERVDKTVLLGDIIEPHFYSPGGLSQIADEAIPLLKQCKAEGVWGNHELGLCFEPDREFAKQFSRSVNRFFRKLRPRYEVEDILFSHTLPNRDATDPTAYYVGPRPQADGALDPCFEEFPHRLFFTGHFHTWFAADTNGALDWKKGEPLTLSPDERYFFTIHAVMRGWAAILDTEQSVLTPVRLK